MTRINTNVSSLTAQKTLARSNAQLQEALTRLSTGIRINTGKDDPAGLIASEILRSDIVGTQKAISNSQRAAQLIATADSSLGQVTSLLNDIRGLVAEAANTGAMSADQIAANQLQVDSSLDALNRISQTTSFQGRRLLDGSLDFITSSWTNPTAVTDLGINQANLGTAGSMAVSVDITTAAEQAEVTATVPTSVAAKKATYTWAVGGDGDTLKFDAATAGADGNDIDIYVSTSASVADGEAVAFYNAESKRLDIYVTATGATETNLTKIETAVEATGQFAVTVGGTGDAKYKTGTDPTGLIGTSADGADAIDGLTGDLVVEISGAKGAQMFSFNSGTSGAQIKSAINAVSDATGVTADFAGTTLTLTSAAYGSNAFVAANVISDGGGFSASLSATRGVGSDIVATVNGVNANGNGNTLSISTAVLDMSATVTDGSSTDFSFTISGGGALFQLGPEVVSNQQARIGMTSVNTGRLGGSSGRLYQLGAGENASLNTNANLASNIVDEALSKVNGLRGRLGAFQRTTIDTNVKSLSDTLENLTSAESSIRDADFAAETANLTRAQILVQSGTSVLALANQSPQSILALLRG